MFIEGELHVNDLVRKNKINYDITIKIDLQTGGYIITVWELDNDDNNDHIIKQLRSEDILDLII